ncbi:MAG TPA: transcriptional regulator [Elusimicrobia bacterium]|nr:transcriptional regulator [Elusimicrobiota bacterium]HBT60397.1 transcriptional regulator [Elusimicrobiota bacterium]
MPKAKSPKPFTGKSAVKDTARIGEIVRVVRKDSKLTQQEAAALCKVGARFLSDLENGKTTLHLGKVLHVLAGLGLTVIIKRKELSDERDS